jgi:folate-binding Fe-S cluster repair protein YgfZ
VLHLHGKDRVRFLNAMVTNDVAGLKPGHACPALVTTTKGKIIAELLVLARADVLVVLVMQGPLARVVSTLEAHIIADDVELEQASEQFAVIAVRGRSAASWSGASSPRTASMEAFRIHENPLPGASRERDSPLSGGRQGHADAGPARAPRAHQVIPRARRRRAGRHGESAARRGTRAASRTAGRGSASM